MSEYLSEEEQIARMKSWWDENGTTVIVSVVVAVAAIVGWRWYDSYSTEQNYEASRLYSAYSEATGEDKQSAAAQLASEFNGSAYHMFVLLQQASQAVAEDNLTAAEEHLETVRDTADDALLKDLARVRLAKIQYGLDRSEEALATLSSVSSEGYRSWAMEAKGDMHAARGEIELAHEAYTAAVASLTPGDQRPVLDMKLKNVAAYEGEFVPFGATLDDAIEQAQQAIEAAGEAAAVDTPEQAPTSQATNQAAEPPQSSGADSPTETSQPSNADTAVDTDEPNDE